MINTYLSNDGTNLDMGIVVNIAKTDIAMAIFITLIFFLFTRQKKVLLLQ